VGVIQVEGKVFSQLLLEADVRGIDSRVFIVATKYAYAGEAGEGIGANTV
jgi:hypothetical protein